MKIQKNEILEFFSDAKILILWAVAVVYFIWLFLIFSPQAEAYTPKEIYRDHSTAVVLIMASQKGSKSYSSGTGSIVRGRGENGWENLVLTNAHVIYDEAGDMPMTDIRVYLKPKKLAGSWKKDLKRRYEAEIVVYDTSFDIALLRIKGDIGDISPIAFSNSESIEVGEPVVAIGHPEQGGLWTLTTGAISAHWADLDGIDGKDAFQTEVSINRGNSGGPLLDLNGGLVGVNTSIARRAADGYAITGVNFSLKSETVSKWMKTKGFLIAMLKTEPPLEVAATKKEVEKPEGSISGKVEGNVSAPEETKSNEEGHMIVTPKRPFKFDELFDFLMDEEERNIEQQMDKLWNAF